jgi:hypothetical protein
MVLKLPLGTNEEPQAAGYCAAGERREPAGLEFTSMDESEIAAGLLLKAPRLADLEFVVISGIS